MPLDGPNKYIYVSTLLSGEEKVQLCHVLQLNADVFTWTHANMTGISPTHSSHRLNVALSAKPVRQKVRRFHPDRHLVIQTEVDNLLKNGFIRAVKYPDWLANVVVVPKMWNKWRVCVDYTDLNDACLKDSFPLPRIDQIMDASTGHGVLSFLDAFLGYHQIPMHSSDVEKNIFHHSPWSLLLQCDAFWFEKCWGYLSEVDNQDVPPVAQKHNGSLY